MRGIITILALSIVVYAGDYKAIVNEMAYDRGNELLKVPGVATEIKYDNFNGDLNLAFDVGIPNKNPQLRKTIKFRYSSSKNYNLGQGVGFSLSLPEFYEDPKNIRAKYIYDTGTRIIEVNQRGDKIYEKQLAEFNQYRKVGDRLFITSPEKKITTIDLRSNQVIREQSAFQKAFINYSWSDGYLKKIDVYNGLSLTFEYKKCDYDKKKVDARAFMARVQNGVYRSNDQCLSQIKYSNGKTLMFEYDNGHLSLVHWQGNRQFSIFKAKYSNEFKASDVSAIKDGVKIYGAPNEKSVTLRLGDHGVRFVSSDSFLASYFAANLRPISTQMDFDSRENVGRAYPGDFDGDGVTDVVLATYTHINGVVDQDILDTDCGEDGESDGALPEWVKPTFNVYFGRLSADKSNISFEKRQEGDISQMGIPLRPICMPGDNWNKFPQTEHCQKGRYDICSYNHLYTSFIREESKILIGDFDGDQRTDVLSCGEKKTIAYNRGERFEVKHHQIACSPFSFAHDINNDGYTDIIDHAGVFVNQGGNLVRDSKFSEIFSASIKYLDSQRQVSAIYDIWQYSDSSSLVNHVEDNFISDTNLDGIPEVVKKDDMIHLAMIGKERAVLQFKNNSSDAESINPKSKLRISNYQLWTGGEYRVDYLYKFNSFLANKVEVDTLIGKHTEVIEHYSPMYDPITYNLLGYEFLTIDRTGIKNQQDSREYYFFRKEVLPKELYKRAPLHGRISRKLKCPLDACPKIKSFIEGKASKLDYGEAEYVSESTYQVLYKDSLGQNFEDDTYFSAGLTQDKLLRSSLAIPGSDAVNFSRFSVKTEYSNFSKDGPMIIGVIKDEGGNGQLPIDNMSSYPVSYTRTNYVVYNGERKLGSKRIKHYVGKAHADQFVEFLYSGSWGKAGFSIEERTRVNANYTKSEIMKLDDYGREVSLKTAEGLVTKTRYKHGENLVIIESDNKKEEILTDLTDVLSHQTSFAGVLDKEITYEYIVPGVPIAGSENSLQFTQAFIQEPKGIKLIRSMKNGDKVLNTVEVLLDGFGRTYQTSFINDNEALTFEKKDINSAGKEIASYSRSVGNKTTKLVEKSYDYMGRLISNRNLIDDSEQESVYKGEKLEVLINGQKHYQKNLVPSSRLQGVNYQDQAINLEGLLSGSITAIHVGEEHSLNFTRSSKGDVSEAFIEDSFSIYRRQEQRQSVVENEIYQQTYNKYAQAKDFKIGTYNVVSNSYDEKRRLAKMILDGDIVKELEYDELGIISKEIYSVSDKSLVVEYDYTEDLRLDTITLNGNVVDFDTAGVMVNSIRPYVKSIEYDVQLNYKNITYDNLTVTTRYNKNSKLEEISVGNYRESYSYNDQGLIGASTSTMNIGANDVSSQYAYDSRMRLQEKPRSQAAMKRDQFFNASFAGNIYYSGDNKLGSTIPVEFRDLELLTVNQELMGLTGPSGRIVFLNDMLHFVHDKYIFYLRVGGRILGAMLIDGSSVEFLPIVTDVRGSLRQVYSSKGELILQKSYSAWGELGGVVRANKKTDYILYDFAGLKRLRDNDEILLSKSRFYHPGYGEWSSLDPLLLKKPNTFAKDKIHEIDGLLYAKGDPINLADPSGLLTVIVHGTFPAHFLEDIPILGKLSFVQSFARPDGWTKQGSSFNSAVSKTFGEDAVAFKWTGGNSVGAREKAAEGLRQMISKHTFAKNEKLNIIAHSHGGNVVKLYTNLEGARVIDNFVALATPQRYDYMVNTSMVKNYVNAYSPYDGITNTVGGGLFRGMPGRQDPAADLNLSIPSGVWKWEKVAGEHSSLHEVPSWNIIDFNF